MIAQKSPVDSTQIQTQITETHGSHVPTRAGINKDLFSLLVLQALNVPNIKTIFRGKKERFVTRADQATRKKAKTKTTKSVRIERQTAVGNPLCQWNQTLDPKLDPM